MEDDLDIMERMDDFYDELAGLDIPDVDIEYQEQDDEDNCAGGACRI